MAKLGTYYGLCPLIDQRNLLGVMDDVDSGHVIVTLGKNIAIKYRLADQKQIHSWRTKDKFSSPVVYDKKTSQYVAVFNQVYIRMWNGDEEYVDKLKKYKFNQQIYTLTKCADQIFVIFKNGTVMTLDIAIENRKIIEVDENTTVSIIDVCNATLQEDKYIGLLQNDNDNIYFCWNLFQEEKKFVQKFQLKRDGFKLAGHILNEIKTQYGIHLFTLWSDGKLFSYPLDDRTNTDVAHQVSPPGSMFAVVESLSCKNPITMVSLNDHYVAMYGAAPNEEGATLILYNSQFKISQSRQPLKLFTSGAKLWHVENNLLLCVGQNLAVIPFRLDTEQLASLVGSHRAALNDVDPDITVIEKLELVSWENEKAVENSSPSKSVPSSIKSKLTKLSNQGLSEATICEAIVPEYIENEDVTAIAGCLDYFCDIPEFCLAKVLKFCLVVDAKSFRNTQPISSDSLPMQLQPLERCMLLDKILKCSFNDIMLLPHLRDELDLSCTLLLLHYLCYLMSEDGHCLPSLSIAEWENKLVDWGCALLDANYQRFLFSRDPQVCEMLGAYSKLVEGCLSSLEDFRQLASLLADVKRGKELVKCTQMANLEYSIEEMSLY